MALVVLTLSETQNRGGLVGASAGALVGLAFLPTGVRLRLIVKGVAVIVIGFVLAVQLSIKIPNPTSHGRDFTVSQLIENVSSLQSAGSGNATATVAARDLLWSLVYERQVADDRLVDGYGFGVNLPYLVNDTQVTSGAYPLQSPHNSHDDVLARLWMIGISLWTAFGIGVAVTSFRGGSVGQHRPRLRRSEAL